MKVAIIGSGWFGCHLAVQLKKKGIQVTIFEQSTKVFSSTSGHNTSKLHQGFHYPRSMETRIQAKLNFDRFVKTYPNTIVNATSYYGIAAENSLLDFDTYTSILDASDLNYSLVDINHLPIKNIEGLIKTDEKNIDIDVVASFFEKELNANIEFNAKIEKVNQQADYIEILNRKFDYCINTTNNHLFPFRKDEVIYEQVVLPIFKVSNSILSDTSIVIMDGPFVSINPFVKGVNHLISIYHVNHSILNSSRSTCNFKVPSEIKIKNAIDKIANEVKYFYPNFHKEATFEKYYLTQRTKNDDACANRECFTKKDGRIIHVFSGKINSIFTAEDIVLKWLRS